MQTVVKAGFLKIPFTFQLISKQVEVPCDGILGRDFLERAGAKIEVTEQHRAVTAFSTKEGHCEYKRLPFGLKTAPATFQRMMNVVLSGLTGTRCFVFLDDIVVYARSLAEHDAKLREVFDRSGKIV